MTNGKQKAQVSRERGVMRDASRFVRVTTFLVLVVSCVALSFTQLGFVGISLPEGSEAYAVVLLLPIALGALLLGTLAGTFLGLIAGVVLCAHAMVMPLDYYELSFVTPMTSVFMLGVCGFLLGVMFSFALRNNPGPVKRVVYITIVCCIVSLLYSIGFFISVVIAMAMNVLAEGAVVSDEGKFASVTQANAMAMAFRLGQVDVQILFDSVLMSLCCILGDLVSRKMLRYSENMGLRGLFAVRLAVVVFIAFMITAGMSFVAITQGELADAERDMKSEVAYLDRQVKNAENRGDAVLRLLEKNNVDVSNLDENALNDLARSISFESLLDGYTREADGTILILYRFSQNGEDGEKGDADGVGDVSGINSSNASGVDATEDSSSGGVDSGSKSGNSAGANSKDSISARVSDSSNPSTGESSGDASAEADGDSMAELLSPPEYYIVLSDDDRFERGKNLDDLVDREFMAAVEKSIATGEMCRAVYDDTQGKTFDETLKEGDIVQSEIVYLFALESGENLPLGNDTFLVMKPASMVFSDRSGVMGWTTLSAFALLTVVFIMVFQLLNRVVVRRIDETNIVLERITEGDLEARVEERDTREFNSLSDGINTTVDALKGWIVEAETRMDAELATAKAIQESALPRTFPPFPDIQRFDVHASMHAAKEVGGDFYDFFLIGDCDSNEGKLGFVIADVSGKGVPAALFMMKSMTQIRDYLQSGMELGEAIENANRQLCDGNDAGMFVTAWVGVLDYGRGFVDFVNAGHNPPLLWQRDGGWRWLTDKSGLPLGLFDGFPYEAFTVNCGIGDQFLLYTDGVTEAMSVEGELYGEKRLKELADTCFAMHPRMLVTTVRRDVAKHAQGAEQSDDITILALEVGVPPEVTATITVPADVKQLPHVNEFIHTELDRRLCPKRAQNQLDIAVEELFVNVAHYAYPDATPENPGTARISYTYSAEPPSVRVDIADDGVPYNPLAKPDAVTPDDIADVPIGGLGILMAKRSVDEMRYEYTGGSNIVTIVKKW